MNAPNDRKHRCAAKRADDDHPALHAAAVCRHGGPGYIPLKEEYPKGGYEVSAANCSAAVDPILTRAMRAVQAG
ncbi:MAG: hypothetical protein N2689_12235 [Verrucomicrobiae bacterium]|nr:hypothetical protein [Verrucomicrobiae bacterium]